MIVAPGQRLNVGDLIGRYEILFPLASGGQGEVWVARLRAEHGFEKFFVLKFILPDSAHSPVERAMFLDEARLAARVSHPNVAQVFELGEDRGLLYLVMERVEGDSLSRLAHRLRVGKGGPEIPLGVSLRVLADISDGLHAAHEAKSPEGIALALVHRDVSPQNIMVSMTGHAKLIDFGVAKATSRLSTETSSATIKGKMRYIAPEQASASPDVDRRADIWSVGVVLFRLITGATPIDGESDAAVLQRLLSVRQPFALPPGSPELLDQIVARTLAPARADRYPTAIDLKQALELALAELSPGTSHEDVARFFGPALVDIALIQSQALATAEAALVGRDQAGNLVGSSEPAPIAALPSRPSWFRTRRSRIAALASLAVVSVVAWGAVLASGSGGGSLRDQPTTGSTRADPSRFPNSLPQPTASAASVVPRVESSAAAVAATGGATPRPRLDSAGKVRKAAPTQKRAPSGASPRALDNPYQ